MTQKVKIMDKVAKLLAMADSTNHTEEATTARRMASDLMAKHAIEELTINNPDAFEELVHKLKRKKVIKYDSVLLKTLCDYCGVAYIQRTSYTAENVFYGRPSDLESFEYLNAIVLSQRKSAYDKWRKSFKGSYGRGPKDAEFVPWFMGFAFGIRAKLEELKGMENEKVQEWGLVPVDAASEALEDYKQHNKTKQLNSRTIRYSNDGYAAGQDASLNKGIKGQEAVRRIA